MLVFNFHHIEPVVGGEKRHDDRRHISITTQGLRQFIRFIRSRGIEPVSLREAIDKGVAAMPQRNAIITIDDGFENIYEHALPVFKEENCPATLFVLTDRLGGTNTWDQSNLEESERDRLMTLEQLKKLAECPLMSIGSHGKTHRDLAELDEAAFLEEANDSHEFLSQHLGNSYLPIFAYPFGSHSQAMIREMMPKTPYKLAMYTKKGAWTKDDGPYEIPRFSVFYRDRLLPVLMAKFFWNGIFF